MKTAAIAICLVWAVPASADWTHKPSGISLPDSIGDMTKGEERDNSNGEKLDVWIQYGSDPEPVTLYVYRSSHPNPALWFQRTRAAMTSNVGNFDVSVPPRAVTTGGAAQPNGLREEYALSGRQWKATSVAIAQNGEWIVKARVTSSTLDRAGVAARMDRLLAAMKFAGTPPKPLALRAPGGCSTPATLTATRKDDRTQVIAASVVGLAAMADARGGEAGLSGKPDDWCRDDADAALASVASLYRRIDGGGWTALLGDAGLSVAAVKLSDGGAALYMTRVGPTQLVATFDGLPSVTQALSAAGPVMQGQVKPLAEIGTSRGGS